MPEMKLEDVVAMIKTIISSADYDLFKSLDPELAEEPEMAEQLMDELVECTTAFIKII